MSLQQAFKVTSMTIKFPVGHEGQIDVKAHLVATGHFHEDVEIEIDDKLVCEENDFADVEVEGTTINYKARAPHNQMLEVTIYIH
jgi:hypothetical protein